MKKAGEAMKQIHGQLDIAKVDETMYVFPWKRGLGMS